ncbi:GNAT family N-acetyltransferase [Paenibacillus sp. NPDC056579]|uniref:GNAT family N-acetyltransferase n=1 Tax=unclassified Paenibacillus TaxID=185978 RepID=UPI001EF8EA45|nr:GNAT family N-acetyltransferase [Paenibacillus sp. H1-7]ULL17928.1 GNAT family N-acetyltransferase [Paenibacillus sp. H1-7]
MHIRVLGSADAEVYREVRLRALKEHSEAFLADYETELQKPIEVFRQNLAPAEGKFTLGCFSDSKQLVGIVTLVRETKPKIEHKANIYAMYVAPEARGQQVGRSLLNELLQRAKSFDGLELIKLTVVSNNGAAKRLYASLGFTVYGTEARAVKVNGTYLDEDMMILTL